MPGDILEYHRGFLAVDIGDRRLAAAEQKALRRARPPRRLGFDAGLVHLVQRRNGPNDFSSLAIGPAAQAPRDRPLPPIAEDVG